MMYHRWHSESGQHNTVVAGEKAEEIGHEGVGFFF